MKRIVKERWLKRSAGLLMRVVGRRLPFTRRLLVECQWTKIDDSDKWKVELGWYQLPKIARRLTKIERAIKRGMYPVLGWWKSIRFVFWLAWFTVFGKRVE